MRILKTALTGLVVGAIVPSLVSCSSISLQDRKVRARAEVQGDSQALGGRPYFDWPVNQARLTRGFFTHPAKRRGRPHMGIDLAAPKNTPILASHSGLVIYVGKEFRGYGRLVMIEGADGYASLYAHLTRADVRPGQRVKQGQQIGTMGRTGRATGVHLHFEIRRQAGPVDPLQYLPRGAQVASYMRDSR